MSEQKPQNLSRRRFLIESSTGAAATNIISRVGIGTTVFAFAEKALAQVIPNANWRSRSQANSLWLWGLNTSGQVGDGSSTTSFSSPVHIGALTKYTKGAVGTSHSVAIASDGSLWAWGDNSQNAVGVPGNSYYSSPVQVGTATWSAVAAGDGYTLARKGSTTYAWGKPTNALGVGDSAGRTTPTALTMNFASVFAKSHSAGLRVTRELFMWGPNSAGQLGDSSTTDRSEPTPVGSDLDWSTVALGPQTTAAIKTNGTLWAWGDLSWFDPTRFYAPAIASGTTDWSQVSTGGANSHAIKTNGTLWGWGDNRFGQVGDGTTMPRISPVQIGSDTWSSVSESSNYACAIRTTGALFAWGQNTTGQLGDGSSTSRSSPVQVGALTNWASVTASYGDGNGWGQTVAIKTDGTLWFWGRGDASAMQKTQANSSSPTSPVQVGSDVNWLKYATGYGINVAVKTDGTLWTWGELTQNGERGYPFDLTVFQNWLPGVWNKVAMDGARYTIGAMMGIKSDGTLWARVGFPYYPTSASYQPSLINSDTDWASVAVSREGGPAFAIKSNGTLWSIGDGNGLGRIGWGTLAQIGSDSDWASVSAFRNTTFALKTDGSLWCWGENGSGQLGDGTVNTRTVPARLGSDLWSKVSVGFNHVIAIRSDGTVWTWGANFNYQLGDGTMTSRSSPVQLGSFTATDVSAGHEISHIVKSDGTLWGFGGNAFGCLGLGDDTVRSSPVQIGSAANWSTMVSSNFVTAGIRTNGTLWMCGKKDQGQTGIPGITIEYGGVYTLTQIGSATNWVEATPGEASIARRSDGSVWTCGQPSNCMAELQIPQQVGLDTNWSTVAAAGAGYGSHVLATKTNGTLWAWGRNADGQLGDSTNTNRSSPVQVGGATNWTKIAAGLNRSYGIRGSGTLWSFGSGYGGGLGNGSIGGSNSPVQVGALTTWTAVATSPISEAPTTIGVAGGQLLGWGAGGAVGYSYSSPVQVGSDTNWSKIAIGDAHAVAIKTDGSLWSWFASTESAKVGAGRVGWETNPFSPVQLGAGSTWTSVAATGGASYVIRSNGDLFVTGFGTNGRLGISGDAYGYLAQLGTESRWVWVSAGPNHTMAGK